MNTFWSWDLGGCVVQYIGYSFVNRHWIYCTVRVLGAWWLYIVQCLVLHNTLVLTFNFVPLDSRCPNTGRIYDNNNNNNGGKMEEAEDFKCVFVAYCVL